jgi:large subunit ribosomal protein L10
MNRVEKEDVIKELNETFKVNKSVLLIDFTGLNVADSTNLRQKISEAECGYRVIKNRLALRALEDTSLDGLKEHFQGPTAIAYTVGDPVALAKLLKTFIEDHPGMSFKAGVVDGQAVSAGEMENLAEMPSRPELLAKLLYLLNAPLTQFATALQSPLRNLASVLKQLGEKKEKEQSPAPETPSPEQAAAPEEAPEQEADQAQAAEPEASEEAAPESETDQAQTAEPETPEEAVAEPEAVPEAEAEEPQAAEDEAKEQ